MKRFLVFIILSVVNFSIAYSQCPPAGGGLFVNEIYNGSSVIEYIELVVLGDPTNPTNAVNLAGWIIDDNNIDDFSQGTADGHLILDNSFSNLLPGTIILLYNSSEPYGGIPASNPPYLMVVGISHDADTPPMQGCRTVPNSSDNSYSPCATMEAKWKSIVMRNDGDFVQVRQPSSNYFHGLLYGGVSVIEAPAVNVGLKTIGLDCGDWFDASNYTITTQTPGDFNSTENEALIMAIRAGTMDCNDIDPSCSPLACPEINDMDPLADVCENLPFTVIATDIANMDSGSNGETDFGVNFLSFPGAIAPANPYIGGTSLGTVPFGSLGGVDPNQTATLNVAANTMIPGIYNICAILDPIPGTIACNPFQCQQIEILDAPLVELSGSNDFCPDDCYVIEVMITSGVQPFDVDFRLQIGSFPALNQTLSSYDLNNQLKICYDGGFFPSYTAADNTLHVPTTFTGSGTLEVVEVNSGNSCKATIVSSTLTLNFLDAPDSFLPTPYELCDDDTDGFVIFDLTTKSNEINGNTGNNVFYYEDMNLTIPILPAIIYFSNTKIIYAQVESANGCKSDAVELSLVVLPLGDEGIVNIFCENNGNKVCDFCVSGNQAIDILFSFQNTTANYTIEIQYGNSTSGYVILNANNIHDGTVIPFTISENTEFILTSITQVNGCPDETDLGDTVFVSITAGPEIDMDAFQISCDSVILAPIVGINLSGNESYYTMPNGMGLAIAPGSIYFNNTTLYIYDEINNCTDEVTVDINIVDIISFDEILDSDVCGIYQLPEITGTNLTGDEAYYTGPNGSGIKYNAGDNINMSTTLYIFDVSANCLDAELDLSIMIASGPSIVAPNDTTVCDTFILETIMGTDLNGTEFYNTLLNALGDTLYAGDTIVSEQLIYLYASNGSDCISQDSFWVHVGSENNVGQDSTIDLCVGTGEHINIWTTLGTDVDPMGIWTDVSGSSINISDSTDIDFSSLLEGVYLFKYQLLDTLCGIDSAIVSINIFNQNAGNSINRSLCQDDNTAYNIESDIGIHDTGGIWKQDPPGTYDISDPTSVFFNDVDPGTYKLIYFLDENNGCIKDSATITITLRETVDAGKDTSIIVCLGSIIDLTDYIDGASIIDTIYDDDVSGGLTNTILNTTLLTAGTYHYTHFVDAISPCPDDDAIITVEVVEELNAGADNSTSLCVGEMIDLTTLLMGADTGGNFNDDDISGFLSGNIVVISNNNTNPIHFTYSIGGGACPIKTAEITININAIPEISWNIDNNQLCEGECGNVSINLNGSNPYDVNVQLLQNGTVNFDYNIHTLNDNLSIYICNGSGVSLSNDSIYIDGDLNWGLNVSAFNDNNCTGDPSSLTPIDLSLLDDQYITIDTTNCIPVVIQGITFDQNHTQEIIEINDPTACKVFYDVIYHYYEPEFTYEIADPECPEDNGQFTLTSVNGDFNDFHIVLDLVNLPIDFLPFSLNIPVGDHEVYVVDQDGCESQLEMFNIEESMPIDFSYTLDSINENQMQFNGTINTTDYTIMWTPGDSLSCTSCLNPIINRGQEDMTYTLEIMYNVNCVHIEEIFVPALVNTEPEPEPEDKNVIYIPNVFNPDREKFYVSTKDDVNIDLYEIYDRWGNLLYSIKNFPSNNFEGWNGTFRGAEVQPGVYVYLIITNLNGDEKNKYTGDLTLIR